MLALHYFYSSSMEKRQMLTSSAPDSLLLWQREQLQGCSGLHAEVPNPDRAAASSQDLATGEARHGTMAQASLLITDVTKGGHPQNPHHI